MSAGLPFGPPVRPMLARLARTLPAGERYVFEPKWDGFRCVAFRAGAAVELVSRHERPLTRYFPEVVEALQELDAAAFVIDGELMVPRDEAADFGALMARLHPRRRGLSGCGGRHPPASSSSTSWRSAAPICGGGRSNGAGPSSKN